MYVLLSCIFNSQERNKLFINETQTFLAAEFSIYWELFSLNAVLLHK